MFFAVIVKCCTESTHLTLPILASNNKEKVIYTSHCISQLLNKGENYITLLVGYFNGCISLGLLNDFQCLVFFSIMLIISIWVIVGLKLNI